eukprot:EG_transcript_15073
MSFTVPSFLRFCRAARRRMVSLEEFEAAWTPEAITRAALQSDESYTRQLADRCRDLCRLFGEDMTPVKFRLLDSLSALLARFAGECRGQGLTRIANVDVWGTDWAWLADARRGVTAILTEKKKLRQEYRVAALRLYDLLAILFGDEWAWDGEGRFAQLVVGTSQVELEVALEAVIRHMEQADVSGNTPSSAQEPPPTPEDAAAPAAVPVASQAGERDTDAVESLTEPEALRTATLATACSILQTTIRFLTADVDDSDGPRHWAGLPPDAIAKLYEFLVSSYSVLLNYFIFRQGVVHDDVDVICIGLLEDLMQDMDSNLFAEEAETVREMLHTSGYYEEAARDAA